MKPDPDLTFWNCCSFIRTSALTTPVIEPVAILAQTADRPVRAGVGATAPTPIGVRPDAVVDKPDIQASVSSSAGRPRGGGPDRSQDRVPLGPRTDGGL